jgi:alpha-galactosidase/6-phospho-beta-glucosidase family protein
MMPRFLATLGREEFSGIPASDIATLQAVPLKYHRLLTDKTPAIPANRANALLNIGAAIVSELRRRVDASPPSLARRDTSWYRDAVVPMMMALLGGSPGDLVATLPDDGDIAWERKITVDRATVRALPSGEPPCAVKAILAPLAAHEQAVVAAAREPGRSRIAEALNLDPLIPQQLVEPIAAALDANCRERNYSER